MEYMIYLAIFVIGFISGNWKVFQNLFIENKRLKQFKKELQLELTNTSKRGVFDGSFTYANGLKTCKYKVECIELDRTATRTKIKIVDVACELSLFNTPEQKKEIIMLVGNWIETNKIEWSLDNNVRKHKIDLILKDLENE